MPRKYTNPLPRRPAHVRCARSMMSRPRDPRTVEHQVRHDRPDNAAHNLRGNVRERPGPQPAPNHASTNEIIGLRCEPETGPTMLIIAKSPAPIAKAFSRSSRPISPGESAWAARPEPTTTPISITQPTNSPPNDRLDSPIGSCRSAFIRRNSYVVITTNGARTGE